MYPSPISSAHQRPKCAVRGLSLGVKKGECFGLLGDDHQHQHSINSAMIIAINMIIITTAITISSTLASVSYTHLTLPTKA